MMITSPKKRAEQGMEENKKRTIGKIGCIIGSVLLIIGSAVFFAIWQNWSQEQIIRAGLLFGFLVIIFFSLYRNMTYKESFWNCMIVSSMISVICMFLPAMGWPILSIYLIWSLFSEMEAALLIPSGMLLYTVFMTGASKETVMLYLFSGIVVVMLFHDWKDEKTLAGHLSYVSFAFLICQCIFGVLAKELRVTSEDILVVGINLIITLIGFFILIKLYLNKVVDKYRDAYLTLNEPTNPVLIEYKETQPEEYMLSVHIAYFCDRVAQKIGISSESIRCAAYYKTIQEKVDVPPEVKAIWKEYKEQKNGSLQIETLILICAESIVSTLTAQIKKNGKKASYVQDIQMIFEYLEKKHLCHRADVTVKQWDDLQKVFLEEKLYYDFLCRE